jgi:3',5'-cyclic AMP phosphodiesterase CpdA
MDNSNGNHSEATARRVTRRQVISSLAALTAASFIQPSAALSANPVNDKIRFAVLGDWGTGEDDEYAVAAQMYNAHRSTPLDFILTAGDNIYPDGAGRHFVKKFERPFASLIRDQVKFYAVLGNHDVEEGRNDQRSYPLFNMGGRPYYTVQQGDGLAEFFMIDSTDLDSTQTGWLEQALRDSKAKWKVALFHHPIYSSGKKHGSEPKLREILSPIFQRYRVNAVISGHDHIYERSKPQQGIHYFVTGAGGKIRRGGADLKSPTRAFSYDEDNHFMLMELDDRMLRFQAVSETGLVVDRGTIEQP